MLDDATLLELRCFNNPLLVHGIGLAAIIFFGLCAVFAGKKLLTQTPGLVFNSAGLVGSSSGIAAGVIPWSDIVGIEEFKLQRQKMLVIKLRDPASYIERGGAIKRALNRANYNLCDSPIALASNTLKVSFVELQELMTKYLKKYGSN